MTRRYPLPVVTGDDRFTAGLLLDVADLLAEHGYPPIASHYDGVGQDLADLQATLFTFLYATDSTREVTP